MSITPENPPQNSETRGFSGEQQAPQHSKSWRVVDIIVAAVLGVACGLIFWVWNGIGGAAYGVFDAATPGLGGLAVGIWLLGGVLGGLIIRKPGAALFVEVLAAVVSALLGNHWGIETVYSGLAQGLGAELVFAIFDYRRAGLGVAMAAGAVAAIFEFVLELATSGNYAKSLAFNATYLSTMILSGILLAGLVGWLLVRGLAATGALDRFPAGRQRQQLV